MGDDILLRGMLADANVRFTAISAPALVQRAKNIHGLSRVCTAALGRTLLAACMMGTQLKNQSDKLTVIIKGGGPAGNIVCTAKPDGAVKGYIENPSIELPPTPANKLDVAAAVGCAGELTVIRDMGLKEPYVGRCNMASGEIAEDFAQYFTLSEQQPSLVYLGVRVRPADGEVLSACGVIIQPLPGCREEVLDELQKDATGISALSGILAQGDELEPVIIRLLAEQKPDVTQRMLLRFECDCNRERLEKVIISLGREEIEDMIAKEHGAELTCQFCNTKYYFNEQELTALLNEASKNDN